MISWASALVLLLVAGPEPASRSMPAPLVVEGEAAPSFQLRTLDGSLVKLEDLAYPGKERAWAKKRAVLLDFFRTDCSPCRAAMPALVALAKELKAQGTEVIVVALLEPTDGREKLSRYAERSMAGLTVVVDESDHVAKKYLGPSVTLPASFLIDRDGRLEWAKRGAGDLKAAFERR